jgi:hypothetical protein
MVGLDDWNYWLQIMEVPKFQTKISINMVLLEVFEFFTMIDFDSGPILLIYDVFCDVRKVL